MDLTSTFLRNISSFIGDFSGFLNEDDKNISSHVSYITLMIVHKELYQMYLILEMIKFIKHLEIFSSQILTYQMGYHQP